MTTIAQTPSAGTSLQRRALQADLAVSGVSTVALLLAAGPLATATGIPAELLRIVAAVVFLPFVALLAFALTRGTVGRGLALLIIGLNFGWVALSAAALIFGWLPLTPAGFWVVVAQAVVVDLLAVAQLLGLRRPR